MRPKIVIIVLLAGAAGLAGILFLKYLGTRQQPVQVVIAQPAISTPAASPAVPQISPAKNNPASVAPVATAPLAASTTGVTGPDAASLQKKIDRLEELEANDDAASLKEILAELTNTNRIIRHVAIEATVQFGGHTAVPVLRDLASRTWDPAEKKELLDAADFLELPTLSEVRAQNPNVKIIRH